MSMTGKPDHTLVLSGDAGIKSAQDVAASLRQALADHERIGIDTQTLTAADLTTVQTLLAARAKAAASGKALALLAPIGEPLQRVLSAAGLLATADAAFWAASSDQHTGTEA